MCPNSARSNSRHAALVIRVAHGVHLAQHERMAADRALAEDDQVAREDVGALDRDRDRDRLIAAAEVVVRPEHDALAAVHVHGVVGDSPPHLGDVIFQDRRGHRRLLAVIDRRGGDAARRVHDVGETDHARDHLLDALEAPDRGVELAADARIGAGGVHGRRARRPWRWPAARCSGPPRAARPACASRHRPCLQPADDAIERHEHVVAAAPVRSETEY